MWVHMWLGSAPMRDYMILVTRLFPSSLFPHFCPTRLSSSLLGNSYLKKLNTTQHPWMESLREHFPPNVLDGNVSKARLMAVCLETSRMPLVSPVPCGLTSVEASSLVFRAWDGIQRSPESQCACCEKVSRALLKEPAAESATAEPDLHVCFSVMCA